MATTKQDLTTAASKPRKMVADGVVVERHSLKDLIEADDRISSTEAVKTKGRGLVFTKTKPPGTV